MKIEQEIDKVKREEYLKIAAKVIYALGEVDKKVKEESKEA